MCRTKQTKKATTSKKKESPKIFSEQQILDSVSEFQQSQEEIQKQNKRKRDLGKEMPAYQTLTKNSKLPLIVNVQSE